MAGIRLIGLEKNYQVEERMLQVLRGIDLQIPEKKITVLLGQSGCGKTTLLRLTGGLEKPDAGEIRFDSGHKTAFVFQEPRLMPWKNVWGNVTFGLRKEEIDEDAIHRIIATVGLSEFTRAYPSQLSGGMQQRCAIARALAYEPSFIMMDEPFAALDYFTRGQMQKELLRVHAQTGSSILFVTHSIDEALTLADKSAIMENGVIKAEVEVPMEKRQRDLMDDRFIDLKRKILLLLDR